MLFNSMEFLLFFPIVVCIYFTLPFKIRYIWLLVVSYYFYMCWNTKYALLILFSTIITYISGILIENLQHFGKVRILQGGGEKCIVFVSFFFNLSVLFLFKYFEFTINTVNGILGLFHIQVNNPVPDLILPVGISFYTFQALSYTMDVYRRKNSAERNFFKYALYVSFFPQLVAGPIERSSNLLKQINRTTSFEVKRVKKGLLIMAYGLFVKVVAADNIAVVVNNVFADWSNRSGGDIVVAIILFSMQIYCDFEGYTKMAIGSAKVLGYELSENFNSPYLANSIKDFWRKWHITLTSWFRDYLYIPLGGNRKGKGRKYLNTMIVFLSSGLWHGAAWHYVAWGGLNGFYIVIQDITEKIREAIYQRLKIKTATLGWKIFQRIVTFLLISYAWLYFRANSVREALLITKKIFCEFHWAYFFSNEIFEVFTNIREFFIIVFSIFVVLGKDFICYKGKDFKNVVFSQQIVWRWMFYFGVVLTVMFFGAYGDGYEQTQFIYFQF